MDIERFGYRIKQARLKKGMTQIQLSEKIGISNNYLSVLERGDKQPSYDVLIKLSDILEVSIDELIMDSSRIGHLIKCGKLEESLQMLQPEQARMITNMVEFMISEFQKMNSSSDDDRT